MAQDTLLIILFLEIYHMLISLDPMLCTNLGNNENNPEDCFHNDQINEFCQKFVWH